jgi:hypothetical protein
MRCTNDLFDSGCSRVFVCLSLRGSGQTGMVLRKRQAVTEKYEKEIEQ